jgi:integrase
MSTTTTKKAAARIRYLTTQRGIYYYKRDVPSDIRHLVAGQPHQWWQSLRTKDAAEAQAKVPRIAATHDKLIRDLRRLIAHGAAPDRLLTAAKAMQIDLPTTLAAITSDHSTAADHQLREVVEVIRATLPASIRAALSDLDVPAMVRARAHLDREREEDATHRAALAGMPAAVVAAYDASQDKSRILSSVLDGLTGGDRRNSILDTIGLPATTAPGCDVLTVCRAYLDDTATKRTSASRAKIEARVQQFVRSGACPSFADWKALRAFAVAYLNNRLTTGRALSVVRMEAGDLIAIGKYAVKNDLTMRDPFAGLKDHFDVDKTTKDSTFMPSEVHKILARAKASWPIDHWQALHCLAGTGMRANEVLQLRPCDVRQVTALDRHQKPGCGEIGDWIIDVNLDPDTHPATIGWPARHLKEKENTIRLAPIHKDLLPILLDAKSRNADAPRLFHRASLPNVKNAVDALGDRVTTLIKRAGIEAGSRKFMPCHGWRHTVSHLAEARYGNLFALSLLGKAPGEYGRALAAGELKKGLDELEVFGVP